jgi:hypothetical protein
MIALIVIVAVLVVVLSRPPISNALLGLLKDRKELALYALFVLVEVALTAIVLTVFGPRVGIYVILASVLLFAFWATRPPAKRR